MTNYKQIETELVNRGYGEDSPVTKAVLELLYILDAQDLQDEGIRRLVVDQFHTLAVSPNTTISNMMKTGASWGPFRLGTVPIGAVIRVKKGAFTSLPGTRFNGLVGRLVGGRGGKAIVRFLGHKDNVSHYIDPQKLETLLAE